MRRLLVVLGLIGFASDAAAAEFELPTLRGTDAFIPAPFQPAPPTFTRWSGFYAGGQLGYSFANMTFSNRLGVLVADDWLVAHQLTGEALPSDFGLPTPSTADTSAVSIGGFVGYNMQFDEAVIGVEANYSHSDLRQASANSIEQIQTVQNVTYDVTLSGSDQIHITDVATFRARAAWVASRFLPYAFGGLAVARADTSRSATLSYVKTVTDNSVNPPTSVSTPFGPFTSSDPTKMGGYYFGYAGGLGIDMALTPYVFVRAEWEIMHFPTIDHTGVNINTARTALGVRF